MTIHNRDLVPNTLSGHAQKAHTMQTVFLPDTLAAAVQVAGVQLAQVQQAYPSNGMRTIAIENRSAHAMLVELLAWGTDNAGFAAIVDPGERDVYHTDGTFDVCRLTDLVYGHTALSGAGELEDRLGANRLPSMLTYANGQASTFSLRGVPARTGYVLVSMSDSLVDVVTASKAIPAEPNWTQQATAIANATVYTITASDALQPIGANLNYAGAEACSDFSILTCINTSVTAFTVATRTAGIYNLTVLPGSSFSLPGTYPLISFLSTAAAGQSVLGSQRIRMPGASGAGAYLP